ncbi:MAG: AI-2E family transporter [Clostridiales bacterium]|nr:AI-2E family transporter [Clostridiales bacterium]
MKKFLSSSVFKRWIFYFTLALAVIFAYRILPEFSLVLSRMSEFLGVLSPFFMGFILAYILNIPRRRIEKLIQKGYLRWIDWVRLHHPKILKNTNRKFRTRALSIIITMILFFFVIFILLSIILPNIYRSLNTFVQTFPSYFSRGLNSLMNFISHEDFIFKDAIDSFLSSFSILSLFETIQLNDIIASIENISNSIKVVANVSSYVLNLIIAVISSIYLMLEAESIKKYLMRILRVIIKKNVLDVALKYLSAIDINFNKYLYCQIIDAVIIGTLAVLSLSFISPEYSFMLGIMIGIMNIIPYFGAIISGLVSVLIILFTGGPTKALITLVIVLVMQQLDGNILMPWVLGGSLKISPLFVIVSITIGGAYFGVVGLIIAIPVAVVIKSIADDLLRHFENRKTQNLEFNQEE